ncbi:inactive polyglycylase TTLL10 [Paroedura picta]|uniref:inactive polyglycylase TTLL10 n=1 Tax=Paroedura picta TaxID=143630 RepID=UPI00405793EB
MEPVTKKNYCAFVVNLEGSCEEGETGIQNMQEAFEKFRRRRQEELRRLAGRKLTVPRRLQQPEGRWRLRMRFLERAKSYIGVPYAKKYHQPGTPESDSPLFLDCCGLIRRVVQDLKEDFGFCIGLGNQAYLYDTLPVTLPGEEHLKPGDLIFISGTYFDTQRIRQAHDIVHVEIWLGEEERSLGARWKTGKVQVFDSYKFVSKTYGSMKYHFKSIETWLQGICVSHCPEHKWASARQLPGRKSIFSPLVKQNEPAEKEADAQRSPSESQPGNEEMRLKVQNVAECASDSGLGTSKQMEALDLPGLSRAGSGVSRTNDLSTELMKEASKGQLQPLPASTFLETGGLCMGSSGASLEGHLAQESGSEEGPLEPEPAAQCQEASMDLAPAEPTWDSVDTARKSRSTSKVNSKGVLVGVKRNKKARAGTQRGNQHLDGPPSTDAGFSNLGDPTNETQCKGNKAPPKASPRMNPPEEKKPEEAPGLGPFFYIGGANGVDIVNVYCKNKGWQRIYDNRREDYLLKWCETKFRDTYYNFREGEQLLYQIPNNKLLTTKIGLLVNLREYERVMRKISRNTKLLKMEEFFPETFRLDTKDERELFFAIYREPHIWICKPTGSNQGRGIFLLKSQEEVKSLQLKLQTIEDDPVYKKLPYKIPQARIVQRYIDRPLLLEGKKFDVRSYLLIACTLPYMLFFGHGYVRLTCLNYDPLSEDLTSHLTNQYVQKKNPIYSHVKEETVWGMERFNTYINERFRHAKGLPKDWVFNHFTKRMKEIMLQCFLAVKSKLDCKLGYFDLIGCDFLIDEDFKVWLLEMNANPALHTNCSALKSIVPTVVNETLDLALEIFSKSQKSQPLLPLESLTHFVLLYNGVTSDNGPPRPTKSRTSLRSLRGQRSQTESGPNNATAATNPGSGSNRPPDRQAPKHSEKPPKTEPPGLPEGLSLPPHKAIPRSTLPMPQIQISIVPNLSSCPSVKAVLRGSQVCNSGSQYIIKPVVEADRHRGSSTKAESGDEKAKANAAAPKDRSYATWFNQTFGSQVPPPAGSNGPSLSLTSSQMVSLHLQSNVPPSVPPIPERPRVPRQLMTHARPPADNSKASAGGSCSCGDSPPEDKKASHHRGS